MDSLIHRGIDQIQNELKKVDLNVKDLKTDPKSNAVLEKSLKSIEKKLGETSSLNNNEIIENNLKKISNSISIINDKLNSVDNQDSKIFTDLKKDIMDEVGMVMIGVNNINHYLLDLINQNDKTFYIIEEKLDKIELRSKLVIGLVVSIGLVLIIQILYFFGII
jgi:hypothetical protein